MCKVTGQLLAVSLFLVALPLQAQAANNNQTLVLPLLAPTGSVDQASGVDMARVVTSRGRPADCIAPVAVTSIDGEIRTVPAQGFLIEPGIHAINGRATLDMTHCPLADTNPQVDRAEDLEVDFKPGNTYYIGYDYKPANTREWKLLVWRMEENPASGFQQD